MLALQEILRPMLNARINVEKSNFFHKSYEGYDHTRYLLRYVSGRSEIFITLPSKSPRSQNWGGTIPEEQILFSQENLLTFLIMDKYSDQVNIVSINYSFFCHRS